ncbi:flavonol sulfotransferase-like [Ricinus communis]|uniref:Sulfotransferase n=1 Tax=Ricinus communis TaxID=3988 RepID=B9RLJ3_RICCO|nr:flavonol sulfotransferase-like [Ricinus communis]EEF47718.1 Flavonol 4'-sulfotransferase, putative [Ricinus communis]|eukprot:XP_025012340.1 flavonol sulfotransferase-like [Ricinus communis]
MDSSSPSCQIHLGKNDEEIINEQEKDPRTNSSDKYKEIILTFPRERDWSLNSGGLYQYQDFWFMGPFLAGVLSAQDHFMARSTDIILASFMKTGTVWLKALAFAIVTRSNFDIDSTSPLLKKGPHDCVPFLEVDLAKDSNNRDMTIPLVGTHMPYTSLPKSILASGCKIVYLWRDPKDVFVSMWFFLAKLLRLMGSEPLPLGEAFELFCKGFVTYGPYWNHVLGYWKARREYPEKILFLKYEDMKKDATFHVKKLADFMGYSFTLEEEENGAMQKIVNMCSFENLSNLEVNKHGRRENTSIDIENNIFFRKGKVGDWKSHLTPEMGARLDEIMEQKLTGSGLTMMSPGLVTGDGSSST